MSTKVNMVNNHNDDLVCALDLNKGDMFISKQFMCGTTHVLMMLENNNTYLELEPRKSRIAVVLWPQESIGECFQFDGTDRVNLVKNANINIEADLE